MDIASEQLEALAAAGRRAAGYGLMKCSSGNISQRLDENHLLVKASRCWMAEMTGQDVSVCRLADGQVVQGRKPSVEIGFHSGILRARPDVNVVLHFQAPCATALCCRQEARRINFAVTPEVPFYIGAIAWVDYKPPGTTDLAELVVQAMGKHDLAMLQNHGQVTVGKTFDEAIQRAVFFEMACAIIVQNGPSLQPLSPDAVARITDGRGVA